MNCPNPDCFCHNVDDPHLIKYHQATAASIKRSGRSIVRVLGGEAEDEFPFSYTIGNHLKGLPEQLVVGSSRGLGLTKLSEMMVENGAPFHDGQLVHVGGSLPVKLVKASVTAKTDYTIQAGNFFGHDDYDVMQIVLAGEAGRFPGDADCEKPYSEYPVLRTS